MIVMPALICETLPGAAPVRRARVAAAELRAVCAAVRENGGLLHALWGSDERDREGGFLLRVALQDAEGLLILEHALDGGTTSGYPNLAEIFPAAARMQRAAFDLLGLAAYGGDTRDWLRHAAWPLDYYPLRRDADPETGPVKDEHYPFAAVAGEG